MLMDFLYETLLSGGWVLFPILLTGAVGFYLIGLAWWEVGSPGKGNKLIRMFGKIMENLKQNKMEVLENKLAKTKSPLTGYVRLMIDNRHRSEAELENLVREKLESEMLIIDRHLPLIGVMAAVAPLLGLLGTVTGMVLTFDVITVFGNSNPMLMADGISQALITTQSGLVIAFPLVLMKHQLEERISWLKKQVELVVTQFFNENYSINNSLSSEGA